MTVVLAVVAAAQVVVAAATVLGSALRRLDRPIAAPVPDCDDLAGHYNTAAAVLAPDALPDLPSVEELESWFRLNPVPGPTEED